MASGACVGRELVSHRRSVGADVLALPMLEPALIPMMALAAKTRHIAASALYPQAAKHSNSHAEQNDNQTAHHHITKDRARESVCLAGSVIGDECLSTPTSLRYGSRDFTSAALYCC